MKNKKQFKNFIIPILIAIFFFGVYQVSALGVDIPLPSSEDVTNWTNTSLNFLNLSGTNANQDINISPYDFFVSNLFASNICYSNGTNCTDLSNSSWNESYANTLYQPLEDQRLSSTDDVTFDNIISHNLIQDNGADLNTYSQYEIEIQNSGTPFEISFTDEWKISKGGTDAIYSDSGEMYADNHNWFFNSIETSSIYSSIYSGVQVSVTNVNVTNDVCVTNGNCLSNSINETFADGLYQPLEDQRLSSTDNVTFNYINHTGEIYLNGSPFIYALGSGNLFIGQNAGNHSNTGDNSVCIGEDSCSLLTTGEWNVALGKSAHKFGTTARDNFALGFATLAHNVYGKRNVGIGSQVLNKGTYLSSNVAIGYANMYNSNNSIRNVAIGEQNGYYLVEGDRNVMIGYQAGRGTQLWEGDRNVMIGYQAGTTDVNNNISDKLYISNSDTSNPLIKGDFASGWVNITGDFNASTIRSRDGLTANITTGECWINFEGGIATATNCSSP